MEKFIPYEKMSKRERRNIDRQRRNTWGAISPVSRKVKSKKIYNRKKAKQDWNSASPLLSESGYAQSISFRRLPLLVYSHGSFPAVLDDLQVVA